MQKRSLAPPGREQLTAAKTASNGRSALDEHESPGEATPLVLQGRVQHTSPDASSDGGPRGPPHHPAHPTRA